LKSWFGHAEASGALITMVVWQLLQAWLAAATTILTFGASPGSAQQTIAVFGHRQVVVVEKSNHQTFEAPIDRRPCPTVESVAGR
jgi:hypothetical protein